METWKKSVFNANSAAGGGVKAIALIAIRQPMAARTKSREGRFSRVWFLVTAVHPVEKAEFMLSRRAAERGECGLVMIPGRASHARGGNVSESFDFR